MAQSVLQLATGWKVRGSNTGGGETFRTYPDRLRGHPASCTMGTGSFPGGKSGRGVALTTHPHLAPKSTERSSS